jgi:hypothetical protein
MMNGSSRTKIVDRECGSQHIHRMQNIPQKPSAAFVGAVAVPKNIRDTRFFDMQQLGYSPERKTKAQ